jgi:hypothetical protein
MYSIIVLAGRSEVFTVPEDDKIFSGYQSCQLVKITEVSGTFSVPIYTV